MRSLPKTIWMLGLVSLFMDVSSEMIHSLLPVFLISVMGSSTLVVGAIEGVAEATALISKVFSGVLSDWYGKRKRLATVGYGIAMATKPLFAVAGSAGLVFAARFLDRLGKGIRGAPRDALIADVTESHVRGAAYGLRQSLDSLGACLGPLAAMLLMMSWAGNFRIVFWIAAVPAVVSVAILVLGVREPIRTPDKKRKNPICGDDIRQLSHAYWLVVLFGSVFNLARYSEAFLLLRAQSVGVAPSFIPAMLMLMNVVYSLSVYPVGRLSDRVGRKGLVTGGLAVLILANLILALAETKIQVAVGVAFWGLHMGLTQGLLAAMVADQAPVHLRGTAFGFFNLAGGAALLCASLIAGWLWSRFGAPVTFYAGAVIALIALGIYVIKSGSKGQVL
jgi:MFS family permease